MRAETLARLKARPRSPTPPLELEAFGETFSPLDAAKELGLNPETIYRAIRRGELIPLPVRRRSSDQRAIAYRITRVELIRWWFGINPDGTRESTPESTDG